MWVDYSLDHCKPPASIETGNGDLCTNCQRRVGQGFRSRRLKNA